jgi:hypothetical protein
MAPHPPGQAGRKGGEDEDGKIMAETTNYMLAGYIVIFGAMALYLVSLAARWRRLRQDEEMLEKESHQ